MKPLAPVAGLILTTAAAVFAQSRPTTSPSAVVATRVIGASDEKGIISIDVGHGEAVAVGDLCWFFSGDRMIACGEVFLVSDVGSAVRLRSRSALPVVGDDAVLVTGTQLTELRDLLPTGATIRGRLVRLPPGRRTGWIDIGHASALRLEDSLLVYRAAKDKHIPIARGRVALLQDQTALLAFEPLVANAQPGMDDDVALWPASPKRVDRPLASTVIAVSQQEDGPVIRLVGTARDGLVPGRLVDLYRDGRFVGVASVTTVADPLSVAELIVSASISEPEVGDQAIVRPPMGTVPHPVRAVVFNIQEDVCLLATGEADGIQMGEKFVVRREIEGDSVEIAELTIYTVKIDYAGARVRLITPENHPIQKWDVAERRVAGPTVWRAIGRIAKLMPDVRTAFVTLEASSGPVPGTVVCVSSRVPSATNADVHDGTGIILHAAAQGVDLYIPAGWGDLEKLTDAHVYAVERTQR